MHLFKPEVGESKLLRDPSLARGPDGSVWVGTYGQGILVLPPGAESWQQIRSDTTRPSISMDFVHAFAFTGSDVWYGTVGNGWGVSRDGGRTWTPRRVVAAEPQRTVDCPVPIADQRTGLNHTASSWRPSLSVGSAKRWFERKCSSSVYCRPARVAEVHRDRLTALTGDGPQALTLAELPWFLDDVQIARAAYEQRCQRAK